MTAFQLACNTAAKRTTSIQDSGMALCSVSSVHLQHDKAAVDTLGSAVIASLQGHHAYHRRGRARSGQKPSMARLDAEIVRVARAACRERQRRVGKECRSRWSP